jgi:hypothetical protein
MLAYVFWHRPYLQTEQKSYEAAIVRFQQDLATQPPPGFRSAISFRIGPVPWLDDHPGYEDWCLVDGSWALDPLNGFAVTGPRQPGHDAVAALMEQGQGGLYAHAGGDALGTQQSTVYWLTRPRGISWQAALDPLRAKYPKINIWRRQMVLGPAAEFAVEVPDDSAIDVPPGWQALSVKRVRLPR